MRTASMKDRSHDAAMTEHFRADPTYAAKLLIEVIRYGDLAELVIVLRQMADASKQDEVGVDGELPR